MTPQKWTADPWVKLGSVIKSVGMQERVVANVKVSDAQGQANAHLISAAPELLEAVVWLLQLECPLTGNPSREQLVEHWEYELKQGNGFAEAGLFALRAIAKALGEKP